MPHVPRPGHRGGPLRRAECELDRVQQQLLHLPDLRLEGRRELSVLDTCIMSRRPRSPQWPHDSTRVTRPSPLAAASRALVVVAVGSGTRMHPQQPDR